jgi:hypothetical protein
LGHILLLQVSPDCFGTVNLQLGHTHSPSLPLPSPLINSVNLFHYVDDLREVITVTRVRMVAARMHGIDFNYSLQRIIARERCMSRLAEEDWKAGEKKEPRQEIEKAIEEAKWNMYAEEWDLAETQLQSAKDRAVSLREKAKIDEILGLLIKCKNREKVEL